VSRCGRTPEQPSGSLPMPDAYDASGASRRGDAPVANSSLPYPTRRPSSSSVLGRAPMPTMTASAGNSPPTSSEHLADTPRRVARSYAELAGRRVWPCGAGFAGHAAARVSLKPWSSPPA
jgi:hypothetical protein